MQPTGAMLVYQMMKQEQRTRHIVLSVLALGLTGIIGLLAAQSILSAMRYPNAQTEWLDPVERFGLGRNAYVAPSSIEQPEIVKLDYNQSGPGRVLKPFEPARKRERFIEAAYRADEYWTGYSGYDDDPEQYSASDYHYDNRDHVTDYTEHDTAPTPRPSSQAKSKPAIPAVRPAIASQRDASPTQAELAVRTAVKALPARDIPKFAPANIPSVASTPPVAVKAQPAT